MRRTKTLLLGVGVAALALAAAGSASAAVVLGSTFTPTEECTPAGTTYVQTASSVNSYVAPTDGVITSWAHRAAADPPALQFRVLRQTEEAKFFSLVGESASMPQTALALNEFPTRIPVRSGDIIGLLVGSSAAAYPCARPTSDTAAIWYHSNGAFGAIDTSFTGPTTGYEFDISAQLEPDVDGDGFGDETQDGCPASSSAQGTCPASGLVTALPNLTTDTDPPDTKITKRPPNETEKTTVKLKFRSDEPGSRFECKLDRKPWKACFSPKRVNDLTEGKHKFKVRAVDAAGNTDRSPAKDGFKVVSLGS